MDARFPEYSGFSYEQASREVESRILGYACASQFPGPKREDLYRFVDRLNALRSIMKIRRPDGDNGYTIKEARAAADRMVEEMKSGFKTVNELRIAAGLKPFMPNPHHLPADAAARKSAPIARGMLDFFPLACAEVARVSLAATQQHHPDKEMHWDRDKSLDHADCIIRHMIDRGKIDTDGQRHSAKIAWRALALLQTELEQERKNANRGVPAASLNESLDAA